MSGFKYPEWLLPQEPEVPPARSRPDPEAVFQDALGAEDALTDFIAAKQAALQTGDDPFFAKQGRDALLAAPAVLERLSRLRDDTLPQAPPSRQRDLGERLDLHLDAAREAIGRHLARQRKEWHRQTVEKRQEVNRAQAALSYQDLDEVLTLARINAELGREAARASGTEPDSDAERDLITRAGSGVLRAAIEAALDAGDGAAARTIFEQGNPHLASEDIDGLGRQLDYVRQIDTARGYVDRLLRPLPMRIEDIDAAHHTAVARNAVDWSHDPDQLAANQFLVQTLLDGHRQSTVHEREELERQVEEWLGQPRDPASPWPSRALWMQLDPDRRRELFQQVKADTQTAAPAENGVSPAQEGSDIAQAESKSHPASPDPAAVSLPPEQAGTWRIELRYLPIAHRGHAFLALVGPDGNTTRELHGLSVSNNTGQPLAIGPDGSALVGHQQEGERFEKVRKVATVASGSFDSVVNDLWKRGAAAASAISKRQLDYKGHDPAYELGGSGGEIQNSNSAAYSIGRAMGLKLDEAVHEAGGNRSFPGWGRDLLDPGYKAYVEPPQFGVTSTP